MTRARMNALVRYYHPMRLLGGLAGSACIVLALSSPATPDASAATQPIAGARAAASTSTWTVGPGGTTSGSGVYLDLDDTTTGARQNCNGTSGTLSLKTGSGLPGRGIASVSSFSAISCGGWTVTAGNLPWAVNATHYNPATGITTGTLTGLTLTYSGGGCQFTVGNPTTTSQVRVSYSNGTGHLGLPAAGGNLRFFAVSGCPGSENGDVATLTTTLALAAPQTITSP
jgi:hypothetical protein